MLNGLHTTNLALVWLSNKSIRTILPTFDTYVLCLTLTQKLAWFLLVEQRIDTNRTSTARAQVLIHRFVPIIKKFGTVYAPDTLKA